MRLSQPRVALSALLLWCCAAVHAEQYTVPLFVPASPGGDPQGVLRLVNDAATAGTVSIHAIGDDGARIGPATLTLDALAAVELSAAELASGNAAKGLPSGLGSLSGDVRLSIESDVSVVPAAYVRATDGALSAMNATVLEASGSGQNVRRYGVTLFHPATNVTQPSRLRLINPGEAAARVTIAARDDAGMAASGGTVELTLPGGAARTLTARQFEAGDPAALTGRLGAGTGNWRLSVTSDRPIQAVNVTVGSGGGWNNLSTTAVAGWAPEDQASFEARFLGRAVALRNGRDRVEWQAQAGNRFRHSATVDGVEAVEEGAYRYERTGRDAGRVFLEFDGGQRCEASFYFASAASGWYASGCIDTAERVEDWTGGNWVGLDAGAMPVDLGSGPDDLDFTMGTAIDALTLPAASGGDGEFTYSLSPQVPGLSFNPATRELTGTPSEAGTWLMTYRVRDASGDSDWRYFNIVVDEATGGGERTHEVGDTLTDLPTGSWTPNLSGDGGVRTSGGVVTVDLDDGTYFEHAGHRYTCQSAGGCTIENRRITSGTVVQTASGRAPGGGVPGDPGDDHATAVEVAAGSDTQGDLTAGDVDYFRVVLDAPGTLEAYTTGRTDTLGRLEDADGAELGRNDDGGAGTNFRISEQVSPGTYFVRVAGYSSRVTGDYTLHVRFAESSADTSPSFAAGSGPGDQTYTVGTAISALTLPEASGGDGPLTYSLTPTVPGLIFNATASMRRLTGTPTAAGAYDMTYGVRDTDGDTDSLTFIITVENAGGGLPAPSEFDVDASRVPRGIAYSVGRLYVTDIFDYRVYVYGADGRRISSADFDLDRDNRSPNEIAFANGRFYVVDAVNDKVYAYTASGQRDAAADFDVSSGTYPVGITYADGKLYILGNRAGGGGARVYAYRFDGSRERSSDFDVHPGLSGAITHADGKFYVVYGNDDRVYAYRTDGSRDASSDFYLPLGSDRPYRPYSITYGEGRFYVVHDYPGRTKVYSFSAETLRDALDLEMRAVYVTEQGLYVSAPKLAPNETFTLNATVRNRSVRALSATTLRYYQSSDATISTGDTEVGMVVLALDASASTHESISLTVPSRVGTYYYGACVDAVVGESDTANNCSRAVAVAVEDSSGGAPDLVVRSPSVSDNSPNADGSFTLSATVRNDGDGEAAATTLRYYRSSNATISRSDTQVGTDSVSGLSASGTSAESIRLTAPSSAGTYYFGACVDSVTGESDTDNNCSSGVRVTVSGGGDPGGGDGSCVEVNDVIELGEGESCTITQALVNKYSLNNLGVQTGDAASCSGGRVRLGLISGSGSIYLFGLTIRCG